MLLAVEGGGFFSSSASGYTKGLTLLISGRAHEDHNTPMRVSPWATHFHLLDQHDPDPDPDHLHLAPNKKIRRGCASFFCFRRAAIDGPSPPKVGPARHLDASAAEDSGGREGLCVVDDEESGLKVYLKSSLKKVGDCPAARVGRGGDGRGVAGEEGADEAEERRKVRWKDACGRELAEIREFEVRYVFIFIYLFILVGDLDNCYLGIYL